jgi:RHS repeat-associated protein
VIGRSFAYDLRFPGQIYMAETGLNYNWSRDYDPLTGRYVESDPMGLIAGVNTYAYGLDNPLSYTDPRGLNAAAGVAVVDGVVVTGIAIAICMSVPSCRDAAANAWNACRFHSMPGQDST